MYETFKGSAHPLAPAEIAITAMPDDERVWVPQAEGVWFCLLFLNTLQGQWCNLLRVRRAGILSRHLHPQPVHGYVIKGRWRYLEHDWVAETGSYVFEPPGEIHTLTVPEDTPEMITFFNISGRMVYLDQDNKQIGFEDVFTKIDMCKKHYDKVGAPGADYVEQFVKDHNALVCTVLFRSPCRHHRRQRRYRTGDRPCLCRCRRDRPRYWRDAGGSRGGSRGRAALSLH